MGQKINPIGFRLGFNRTWDSQWFEEKNFSGNLKEDLFIRKYLARRLENGAVSRVVIERHPKRIVLRIHTARPGVIIGRKGSEVDKVKEEIKRLTGKNVQIYIEEIKYPEMDSTLVGQNISRQLVGKVSFRRAMKKALTAAMRLGAEGIKITCSGRLGGAEMARIETYKLGRIPLHTLRADIDYASTTALTTYGEIGVKVWICKGEKMES